MKFQILDILNFSRPAQITSPLSIHNCCANEWVRTDLLEKAYQIKGDPIERMKYICAFAISGIYQGPVVCRSKAPFNPIIGETYQAQNLEDGSKVFMEQTEHHPPTFNFNLIGPEGHFQFNGFGTVHAHLESINVIKGGRSGTNILKFDNGDLFSLTNLQTRINGVVMGDRTYNYYGDLIIKDYTNKIECIYSLVDEEQQGMLSKILFGKKKPQYDEGTIEIKQINPKTREKELKALGYASWLGQVFFDDKVYWSIFDPPQQWTQTGLKYVIPSDSINRIDLLSLKAGNVSEAQENKEKLENIQRNDQKLREAYSK